MNNNMGEIRQLEEIAMIWFMNAIKCKNTEYLKGSKNYSAGVVHGIFTSINSMGHMSYEPHLMNAIGMDIERG